MVPSLESLASLTEADVAQMRVFALRDHLVQTFGFDEKDFTKNHNGGKSMLKNDYATRLNKYVEDANAHHAKSPPAPRSSKRKRNSAPGRDADSSGDEDAPSTPTLASRLQAQIDQQAVTNDAHVAQLEARIEALTPDPLKQSPPNVPSIAAAFESARRASNRAGKKKKTDVTFVSGEDEDDDDEPMDSPPSKSEMRSLRVAQKMEDQCDINDLRLLCDGHTAEFASACSHNKFRTAEFKRLMHVRRAVGTARISGRGSTPCEAVGIYEDMLNVVEKVVNEWATELVVAQTHSPAQASAYADDHAPAGGIAAFAASHGFSAALFPKADATPTAKSAAEKAKEKLADDAKKKAAAAAAAKATTGRRCAASEQELNQDGTTGMPLLLMEHGEPTLKMQKDGKTPVSCYNCQGNHYRNQCPKGKT